MLVDVIGDLLPSAVGVALSPVPIIAVTLVLGVPSARARGVAFALGWMAGLVAVSAVVLLVVGGGEPGGEPSAAVSWIKVAFGAVFLVLAVGQWRSRPEPGAEPPAPKWMAAVDTMGTGRATALAAGLAGLNPKNFALTFAAAASIAQADLSAGATATAVAVFVVIGSLTVAGPVVLYVVAPRRAVAPLAAMKQFMATNNAVIMFVVLLLLGSKLIGSGLAGI